MSSDRRPSVEDVLAVVLDRAEEAWLGALEDACARHPELAEPLRRRFAALVADEPPERGAIPERVGRFRLAARLGGGGMGVVFRARDEALDRDVALKLVRPDLLVFPGARERFRREVGACATLQHEGIVAVHEFGEVDGVPYFAMELVPGLSLAEVVARLGGRDPATLSGADVAALLAPFGSVPPELGAAPWCALCATLVAQAARAIEHAHARGIVHRDVKPGNVMVTPAGRARVLDFGVSLREGHTRLTRSGGMVGSLAYAAPEAVRGDGGDRRVDVYGLGATLYEILALRPPYPVDDAEESRRRILDGRREPLRAANPRVTRDLETVCEKALDLDPARRYPSAAALASDLERAARGAPVEARPIGVAVRAGRFVRRHPTWTAAGALGLALVAGTPTLLWLQSRAYVARLERLSDELVLDDLFAESEALWPPLPDKGPALAAWLARADALLARRPQHERSLALLRGRALPRTAEEVAADEREAETRAAERRSAEERRDALAASGHTRATSRELARAEDALSRLGDDGSRATWRFAVTAEAWQHDRLRALLHALRRLPAARASVEARRAFAASVDARTLREPRDAWARAAAAVRDDPRFGGLALAPQRGLVPLGPDPGSGLLEFAHVQSGDVPARDPATGRITLDERSAIVLVLIPPGEFTMGADRAVDAAALPPEAPPHQVTLDAFFIGKHEITQAQWFRAMGDNPAEVTPAESPVAEPIDLRHPVENVSWDECARMLARLALALPSEAQWEYAARAGTTTPWWSGGELADLEGAANVRDQTVQALDPNFEGCAPFRDGHVVHAPVGSFRANGFGLHDVLGNVNEWVRDTFVAEDPSRASYDFPGRPGDGLRFDPHQTNAVFRGGAFMDDVRFTRVTARRKEERGNRWSYIGLRAARALEDG